MGRRDAPAGGHARRSSEGPAPSHLRPGLDLQRRDRWHLRPEALQGGPDAVLFGCRLAGDSDPAPEVFPTSVDLEDVVERRLLRSDERGERVWSNAQADRGL